MKNRHSKWKILWTVCLIGALLLSFTGCSELLGFDLADLDDWADNEEDDRDWFDDSEDDWDDDPPFSSDCPTLSDPEELRDYLCSSVERGNDEMEFRYTGDEDDLDARNVARIMSAYYVRIIEPAKENGVWEVQYTGYPGDRIVAAYRSGDDSELSLKERKALKVAKEVVEDALAVATNEIELELYLHDWLCDQITYYNGSVDVENEDHILPHLTALGALLDGEANCQGYTDGFYVLASIAGFTVGRQSCESAEGGHSFNTIRLGGNWYVVDVTFNDDSYYYDGESFHDYRLFNAGKNECGEYTWPEEYEYHSLVKKSDEYYYYNLTDDSADYGYTKRYTSVKNVANGIAKQWADSGRSEFHMMLVDQRASWEDLKLSDALDKTGLAYNYIVWSINAGENTYFYVRFE